MCRRDRGEGTSLYVRPFIFGDEPYLGVRASKTYKFMIILSPVGPYFASGLQPTKMYVEDVYVRAVSGGTGEAKCGGNYGGSLKAQEIAHEKGYEQILWLDAHEQKYLSLIHIFTFPFLPSKVFVSPSSFKTVIFRFLLITEKKQTVKTVCSNHQTYVW